MPALREAAAWTAETFGKIDILFANASIQALRPLLKMEGADWQDQIDVNLTSTCNAIRAVAPYLVKNGGGRIIVTSSTQGRHGTKYGTAYTASKWGIIGLMKSAALELGQIRNTESRSTRSSPVWSTPRSRAIGSDTRKRSMI
ncbi:SDR family NAD(P)-dependent oxidoreductase [Nitrobacter hamburgensis]|uniref:SDR family NAD(P)-dependent oxidoreductase n=1 Tax=Nitrobacter hamburgensis TaxID=912 RepID=UPI0000556E0F